MLCCVKFVSTMSSISLQSVQQLTGGNCRVWPVVFSEKPDFSWGEGGNSAWRFRILTSCWFLHSGYFANGSESAESTHARIIRTCKRGPDYVGLAVSSQIVDSVSRNANAFVPLQVFLMEPSVIDCQSNFFSSPATTTKQRNAWHRLEVKI